MQIIKSKERWLSIESDTATAKRFRQRSSRYPVVENAVILWLEKEHNSDITLVSDQMLRYQARQFAQAFHREGSEEFKASSSWVLNFKQRYINQKAPRIEGSGASASLIENNLNKASPDTPMSEADHHIIETRSPVTLIDTNISEISTPNDIETSNIVQETVTTTTTTSHSPLSVSFHSTNSSPIPTQITIEENMPADYNTNEDDLMGEDSHYECDDADDPTDTMEPISFIDIVGPKTNQVESSDTPDTTIQESEPTINISQQEQTKLRAKQHLEAALAFYTSQKSNQSMSADMIKLILQNDF
jgi:hypothetical protein